MDTTINPVSGIGQHYTAPVPKVSTDSSTQSAPQQTYVAPQPAASTDTSTPSDNGASQYEASLRQAALSFKNVYAVSDQNFSIFKDATGKYITRYVSLRDGKVTYLPEPTLVKQLQLNGGTTPHVTISA